MSKTKCTAGEGDLLVPPGSDFLRGLTTVCQDDNCTSRVMEAGDELCSACHAQECQDELRELIASEKSKSDGRWYVKWIDPTDVSQFVCTTCESWYKEEWYGYQVPATDHPLYTPASGSRLVRTVPIAGCCTKAHICAAARRFWGKSAAAADIELTGIMYRRDAKMRANELGCTTQLAIK